MNEERGHPLHNTEARKEKGGEKLVKENLTAVAQLPMSIKERKLEVGYKSPAKTLESVIGAIHCLCGGSSSFIWKGKRYTVHKGKFAPIEDVNRIENRMKEAFDGTNVEVLEVKDNTILIKQNGYSKKYRGQDLNGVLVLERINIRKKKKSCNKPECPFNEKHSCRYDPMSDKEPLCDDSERLLSLGILDVL
jgi:hypothetical protein